jgi:hypothetical protein
MMPTPSQPGTLGQQLQIVNLYLRLPGPVRRRWPQSSWNAARELVLPHARRQRHSDIREIVARRATQ